VPPNARVLDLACGTGASVETLRKGGTVHQVVGIDLTRSELEIARRRAPNALFTQGRVQELPFRSASVDCVICHMALMLFDDVDIVLSEVSRVLSPQGVFGAVTNSSAGLSATGAAVMKALGDKRQLAAASKRAPRIGDPRTQSADPLRDLVGRYLVDVTVEPFTVTQIVPRKTLWAFLTAAAYGLDALPDEVGQATLDAMDLPDPVPWSLPLLLVKGVREQSA
jgi:ubiquinone/menaquinone biosynthesis C-methylase UbiE